MYNSVILHENPSFVVDFRNDIIDVLKLEDTKEIDSVDYSQIIDDITRVNKIDPVTERFNLRL